MRRVVLAAVILAYAVMFCWISVAGVTTWPWGDEQVLPASPVTAVVVLAGGSWAAHLLHSTGKRRN